MFYLITISILFSYLTFRMIKSIVNGIQKAADGKPDMGEQLRVFYLTCPASLLLLPLMITMISDGMISFKMSILVQWIAFAGGVLLFVIAGFQWIRKRSRMLIVCSLIGLSQAYSYGNNLAFVQDDNVGVMAYGFMKDVPGLGGLDCGNVMLIRKAPRGEPAYWRCPKSIILLGNSSKPFVPWPDYTKGHSAELNTALLDLLEEAGKADRNAKNTE